MFRRPVARLLHPPQQINRILVPVENFSARAVRMVSFVRHLAEITQSEVTLLHIFSYAHSDQTTHWAESQIAQMIVQAQFETPVQSLIVQAEDVGKAILQAAQTFDLVVLHSQRYPLAAEGFGFSRITSQVVQQMQQSAIILGESHLG